MEREMRRRNYSERTIESYCASVGKFLAKYKGKPREIKKSDVKKHLISLVDRGLAFKTVNIHLNALKFALVNILNKKFMISLPGAKIPKKLPTVLTKREIKILFDAVDNKKHRLMLMLLYSAGLRVSELVHLKVGHLQIDSKYGWVREGKGRKDRIFIIADSLIDDLKECIDNRGVDSWLFVGRRTHISVRTVQNLIKHATKEANIRKNVHPHTLRHSFATHLIEEGYPLTTVQALLGHNSLETTMIYIHTANPKLLNVKSPLDNL